MCVCVVTRITVVQCASCLVLSYNLKYSRTSMARKPMARLHGYFELVLDFLGKNPIAGGIIIFEIIKSDFLFYIDNGMLCVLIRIASMRRF